MSAVWSMSIFLERASIFSSMCGKWFSLMPTTSSCNCWIDLFKSLWILSHSFRETVFPTIWNHLSRCQEIAIYVLIGLRVCGCRYGYPHINSCPFLHVRISYTGTELNPIIPADRSRLRFVGNPDFRSKRIGGPVSDCNGRMPSEHALHRGD